MIIGQIFDRFKYFEIPVDKYNLKESTDRAHSQLMDPNHKEIINCKNYSKHHRILMIDWIL